VRGAKRVWETLPNLVAAEFGCDVTKANTQFVTLLWLLWCQLFCGSCCWTGCAGNTRCDYYNDDGVITVKGCL